MQVLLPHPLKTHGPINLENAELDNIKLMSCGTCPMSLIVWEPPGRGEGCAACDRLRDRGTFYFPQSKLGYQCVNKYSLFGLIGWHPAGHAMCLGPLALTPNVLFADCRLHICLYYREILVKELTTASPEGCRISHGHTYDASNLDQVLFPYPEDNGQRKNIEKLLSHLERGVVLWMAPDGLYAKRLCQSRIYWDGPLALCSDRPNKLERDQTCKLFDTQQFLSGNIPNYRLELSASYHKPYRKRIKVVTVCLSQWSKTTRYSS